MARLTKEERIEKLSCPNCGYLKPIKHGGWSKKSSGLPRGVTNDRGRYSARITINGVNKNLGSFETITEASEAYNTELKKRGRI